MITSCTGCQTRYRLDEERVPRRLVRVRCPRCQTVFKLDGTSAAARVETPQADPIGDHFGADSHFQSGPEPEVMPGLQTGVEISARPEDQESVVSGFAPTEDPDASESPGTFGGSQDNEPAEETVAQATVDTGSDIQTFGADETTQTPAAAMEPPGSDHSSTKTPADVNSSPATAGESSAQTATATVDDQPAPRRRVRDKTAMLARALVSDILVYNQETRDQALQEGNLLEALGPEIKKSWELYKEKVTPEVANSTTHFRDALNEILAEGQKIF